MSDVIPVSATESTSADPIFKQPEQIEKPAETPPAVEPVKVEAEKVVNAEESKPSAVPEKYELKLDDGSLLNAEQLAKIESYAKDKKLTQEQAQELVNRESAAVSDFYSKQVQEFEKVKTQWIDEIKKDQEIGGDNFAKTAELAKRAVDKFATPQFKEQLEQTGYGNHPELVRVFARIGKLMADDRMVVPSANNSGAKSFEEVFYGKQN